MSLPFNWIFAIFLIIIFIMIAVYGINYFLNLGTCSRIGLGLDDLQQKLDQARGSSTSDFTAAIDLPGIQQLCFGNLSGSITGAQDIYSAISLYEFEDANTFLYPPSNACGLHFKKLVGLDLANTTTKINPYCIPAVNGNINVHFIKNTYDKEVIIK